MRLNSSKYHSIKKQQGSTLVVAIFVIVVLGALVAGLSSLIRTTSESVVVEVLGTRSFMAAQSGLERGMTALYPLGTEPVTACPTFTRPIEIGNCQATLSCQSESHTLDSGEIYTHFRLESIGSCAAGDQQASRRLAIETRVKE